MLEEGEIAFLERASRRHASVPGPANRIRTTLEKTYSEAHVLVKTLSSTRFSWLLPFQMTSSDEFKSRQWSCSLSSVTISTTIQQRGHDIFDCIESLALEKAKSSLQCFAHEVLKDVPVCWNI